MPGTTFAVVWSRIESHAGEKFTQIRGGEFTYKVVGGHVRPDRTNHQIPKSHFEQAFANDGGKRWVVNWIATDTRVQDESD